MSMKWWILNYRYLSLTSHLSVSCYLCSYDSTNNAGTMCHVHMGQLFSSVCLLHPERELMFMYKILESLQQFWQLKKCLRNSPTILHKVVKMIYIDNVWLEIRIGCILTWLNLTGMYKMESEHHQVWAFYLAFSYLKKKKREMGRKKANWNWNHLQTWVSLCLLIYELFNRSILTMECTHSRGLHWPGPLGIWPKSSLR